MYFTDFFPFFLIVAMYALRGPYQWAAATGAMAFFQAASPILFAGGGRAIGLAPAYCLVPVALILLVRDRNKTPQRRQQETIPLEIWLLAYFFVFIIGGAFLLPKIFEGYVNVLPTRGGLDSGFVVPLKPESTNIIQSAYLVFNLLLTLLPFKFAKNGHKIDEAIIKGLSVGAIISGILGFYQTIGYQIGLPWPSNIINSNLGVLQLEEQTMMGMRRMSSTFLEPALLALHFLAAFGLIMLGQKKIALGFFCLAVLVFSTSTTAYIGFAILIFIWVITNGKKLNPQTMKIGGAIFLGVIFAYLADYLLADSQYTQRLLINKFDSGSGAVRLNADALAWNALRDTYGLGVGIGSLRASSLSATLIASAGIPATLIFIIFVSCTLIRTARIKTIFSQSLVYCMLGVLIAWSISIPDWTLPIFWLTCGAAIAHQHIENKKRNIKLETA